MSATPNTQPDSLQARYPHLFGREHSSAPSAPEHLCPHCGEAILQQLAPERSLGVYTAEGWWRCPKCNHQCSDTALKPKTAEHELQAEIDQCRKEDEHRGTPGGSSSKSYKRAKQLPRREFNHLQEEGGGGKDKTVVTPPGEKFTNTSISATNNELELAKAMSALHHVSISQIWRWGLASLKHCGYCPDCRQPSPGESCLLCGLELVRTEGV